jgi:hypothetical protein
MALYRFLFAPVLLAVAVLIGSHERTAAHPVPSAPPAADATAVGPRVDPAAVTASRATAAAISALPAAAR